MATKKGPRREYFYAVKANNVGVPDVLAGALVLLDVLEIVAGAPS